MESKNNQERFEETMRQLDEIDLRTANILKKLDIPLSDESALALEAGFEADDFSPNLLQQQLTKLAACKESIAWAGQFSSARQAWEACGEERWMTHLIGVLLRRPDIQRQCSAATRDFEPDSLEACAAIRRVVPFERLRELLWDLTRNHLAHLGVITTQEDDE